MLLLDLGDVPIQYCRYPLVSLAVVLMLGQARNFSEGYEYGSLQQNRENGKQGAVKFIDFVQARNLRRLELSTSVEVQANTRSPTNCLAIEKIEYRYLLSGALNGSISLYDLEVATCAYSRKHSLYPILEYTPGANNNNNGNLGGATAMVSTLQWYPEDSGAFISAGMTGHVSIFDTNYFAVVANFTLEQVLYCARMRRNVTESALITVALQDGTVRLCDPRTRDSSHIIRAHDRAATCVDWSPASGSEYLLTSAGMDGAVRFWDVRRAGSMNDAVVRCLDWRGDFTASLKIDSRKLYTGQRSSAVGVHIRDATQHYRFNASDIELAGSSARAGRAHDGGVMSLRYTSCGNFVITSGNDQRLRLWHAHTGRLVPVTYPDNVVPVAQLPYDIGLAEMSFASADVLLVPASGNCCIPGACLATGGIMEGEVRTNEGDILVIPAHSEDGQPTGLLRGHLQRVTALAYRKPQQQVISAARDGLVFLWAPSGTKGGASRTGEGGRSAEELERSKQHRLFYGRSGARYDFQQVLNNVSRSSDGTSDSTVRNINNSGNVQASAVRLLPIRLSVDDDKAKHVVNGAGSTLEGDSAPIIGQRAVTVIKSLSSDEGSESGDDWSDEDAVPVALAKSQSQFVERNAGAVKRARTSAASIVSAASSSMNAFAHNEGHSSRAIDMVEASALNTASSSRSFVPPIIQQYMADANRTARSSSQTTTSGTTDAAATAAASRSHGLHSAVTPATAEWENIDRIFDAPASTGAASSLSEVPQSVTPVRVSTVSAAAAKSSTLTADQRYAQWLKQSRSKATKKK